MLKSLRILGSVLLLLGSMNALAQSSSSAGADYVEGVIRVKLQPEVVARMSNAVAPPKSEWSRKGRR